MSRYVPSTLIPTDPAQLPGFLRQELQNIARSMVEQTDLIQLSTLTAEPSKPREGMVAKADGSVWNPGSGAGVYCYRASAWRFLG